MTRLNFTDLVNAKILIEYSKTTRPQLLMTQLLITFDPTEDKILSDQAVCEYEILSIA